MPAGQVYTKVETHMLMKHSTNLDTFLAVDYTIFDNSRENKLRIGKYIMSVWLL